MPFKDQEEYEKWKTERSKTDNEKKQLLLARAKEKAERQAREKAEWQAREKARQIIGKTIEQWRHIEFAMVVSGIIGALLLSIGLAISPSSEYSDVINAHRLHIKQTLYYFSGVCFIILGLQYGIKTILVALADLNQNMKTILNR